MRGCGMKLNQRGEITTLVLVAVGLVSLLVGTLAPTLNPFNRLFGAGAPSAANQKASWTKQDEIQTPVILKAGDTVAVGTRIERHYDTGAEEKPVKLTFTQRIGQFFAHLSTLAFIGIVVSLVFFGGAPLVWIAGKFFKARAALTATVAAIEKMSTDEKEKLKVHLAATQDTHQKVYIAKLKSELAAKKFKAGA